MQQIAERAGVTKPVLYSLFSSKEELFAAVIDRVGEEMSAGLAEATADAGPSRLGPGIRAYLHYARDHESLWGPMLASTHHSAVAAAVARLQQRQVALVADSLRRGHIAAGVDPDDIEIDALANLIAGAVHSVGRWWDDQRGITMEQVAAFLEAALAPTLAALRTRHHDDPWFPDAETT